MLNQEQQLIANVLNYPVLTQEEGEQPADTSLCFYDVEEQEGWPYVLWNGEWYPVPTMEYMEEMVFDSTCETPDEETVEPDHPSSWLSILGMI